MDVSTLQVRDPLRGSTVLAQIDISFAGKNETQYTDLEPKISQAAIVPLLLTIVH